jgi:uncharacterized protein (TIGR03545 family)
MRWKGLITVLVLIGIGLVVSVLMIDRWIEKGLEKTGQAVVGARVEIDQLDFSLVGLSIGWDRMQITDPRNTMQNVVETGRTAFKMNPSALLRKRFVVDEMRLSEIQTGTKRAFDGALPKKKRRIDERSEPGFWDKVGNRLSREAEQLPVVRLRDVDFKRVLNIDSLVAVADITIVDRVDSVKQDVIETSQKWKDFYQGFHPDRDLEEVRSTLSEIDLKKSRSVPEMLLVLDKVKSAQKTLNDLSETIDRTYRETHDDVDRLASYQREINGWVEEDYRSILRKARLPDLSAKNIGRAMFGREMVNRVSQYLEYLKIAQKIVSRKSDKPKKEKKPRMEGQTIHFPDHHQWPAFLIRQVYISGQTGSSDESPGLMLEGEAIGITSQPWIYGRPTVLHVKGEKADRRSVAIRALFDHTTMITRDSVGFVIKNIPLKNMDIAETPYLPSKILNGSADVVGETKIEKDNLRIGMKVNAKGVRFDWSKVELNDVFGRVIADVVGRIDNIVVRVGISQLGDQFDFQLTSNLDDLVSKELKRISSQALAEAEKNIRTRLNELSRGRIEDLDQVFSVQTESILDPVDQYKDQLDVLRTGIDEKLKDIQDDISRRQGDEANQVKDRFKDLLKDVLKK